MASTGARHGPSPRSSNELRVVFIMGTARSGSTLLGTLLGESEGVFYAGELSDWPQLEGVSTVPRSRPFWEGVRTRVGALPIGSVGYKRLFEHPAGILRQVWRRRDRRNYLRLTLDVLEAVAQESERSVIVDSSHYPRRAHALRRILGSERVRLVYLVRRPSSVAQSFQKTGDKGLIQANLYMMAVSLLAWLAYLTHPRAYRTIVRYEQMIRDPLAVGGAALGRPLEGVNPARMAPPLVLIANRFVKTEANISIEKNLNPNTPGARDRISDFVQLPLWFGALAARPRPSP